MLTNGLNEWLGFALLAVASVAIALAVRGVPLERTDPRSAAGFQATHGAASTQGADRPRAGAWLRVFASAALLNVVGLALFVLRAPVVLPWLAWASSVGLAAFLGWRLLGRPRPNLWPRWEIASVVGVTVLAAAFRWYRLDELPPGLWWDEANVGLEAVRILGTPDYRQDFAAGPLHPAYLWFYLTVGSVKLFGATPEALRFPQTFGGILYAPAMYALARRLFGPPAALPAATIAAVLLWNVNFSRSGWAYDAWTVALDAVAITLLIRAVQLRSVGSALAGGLIWGLALHGYWPSRLVLPVGLTYLALVAFRERRAFFDNHWLSVAVFAGGALIAASPQFLFAALAPASFAARPQQVFIWNEIQRAGSLDPLIESLRKHVLMFNVVGDRNGRHNLPGAPMLDQVTAALFFVGLVLCVPRLFRPAWGILPVWLTLSVLTGALTLSFEAPQGLRTVEAQTPAILLAAGALAAFISAERRRAGPRAAAWAPEIVGAVVIAIVGLNYHTYFVRKANDFASWAAYSGAEAIVAEQAAALADTHTVYLDDTWLGHPTIRFLAPGLKEHKRFDPVANVPLHEDGPIAIFVSGDQPALVNDLDRLYPGGGTDRISPPVGGPVVVRAAIIPQDAIRELRGVNVRVSANGRERATREVIGSMDVELPGPSRPFEPAEVELGAVVTAPQFGRYRLTVDGPPGAVLEINGQEVVRDGSTADVQLARGNHSVVIAATFDQPGRLRLLWTSPGEADARPIPPELLSRSSQAARGLLATYRRGTDFESPLQFIQVERQLQRRIHLLPLPRPYTVEWIGTLDVTRAGVHSFWLDAIGRSWLWIDDKPVFSDVVNAGPEATVQLSQGQHTIRARYADTELFSRFDLVWRPPDGERESVPTARLSPPDGVVESPPPPPIPAGPALPPLGEATTRWLYTSPGEVRGVGVAPDGTVYTIDAQRKVAQRLGEFGQPTAEMAGGLGGEPVDIDVGPDGRPVVLDSEQGLLVRYEADGSRPTQLGGPSLGLYRPRGLGIGRDGNIYIANTGGNQIVKVAPDGTVLERFGPGTGGPDELRQPTDVAVGPNGELYVANTERNSVMRLDASGRYQTHWAITTADTLRGNHLAVGPDGGVYVTEPTRGRVVRFSPDGQAAGIIESVRQGRLLRTPVGIAVGTDGSVYIADPGLKGVVAITLEKGSP